jgi:hypothetical protein
MSASANSISISISAFSLACLRLARLESKSSWRRSFLSSISKVENSGGGGDIWLIGYLGR